MTTSRSSPNIEPGNETRTSHSFMATVFQQGNSYNFAEVIERG